MQKANGFGFQKRNMMEGSISRGCCIYCGHCDDEVIEMMTECKCHCHSRGGNTS